MVKQATDAEDSRAQAGADAFRELRDILLQGGGPLAYPIEGVPEVIGVPRDHVFRAIRNKELTAVKCGRRTIIEISELRRWIKSLPTKGRKPEASAA